MTILAALDFSETSRTAMHAAAHLAVACDTELTLLHCIEEGSDLSIWDGLLDLGDVEAQLREETGSRLEHFWEEHPPDVFTPEVSYRTALAKPGKGIVEAAEELDAEHIVIGATGRSRVASTLFGSTAEDVVRRSEAPVLVVPEEGPVGPCDHVLAPVDFSDCSRASLELAASIARRDDATLEILHAYNFPVNDPGLFSPAMTGDRLEAFEVQRRDMFDSFVDDVDLSDLDHDETMETGTTHEVVDELARDRQTDLVVMGTHGRSGFERFFLGSTTAKVLRRMPAPVTTLRSWDE